MTNFLGWVAHEEVSMENTTLVKMLDIASLCVQSNSNMDSVAEVLAKTNELIPFEAATVAIDTNSEFDLRSKQQLYSLNLSPEWKEIYFKKQFYNIDPVLGALNDTDKAICWDQVDWAQRNISTEFKKLSQHYVGGCGLSMVVQGETGSTLISLVMERQKEASEGKELLEYIAPHIHGIFDRRGDFQRNRLWTPSLSKRELEVLHWAKEGKSNWDISMILSISERTVKFHFSNIFKKLEVINRSQAIVRAIYYGLIAI